MIFGDLAIPSPAKPFRRRGRHTKKTPYRNTEETMRGWNLWALLSPKRTMAACPKGMLRDSRLVLQVRLLRCEWQAINISEGEMLT
jgi:hypothetical protein